MKDNSFIIELLSFPKSEPFLAKAVRVMRGPHGWALFVLYVACSIVWMLSLLRIQNVILATIWNNRSNAKLAFHIAVKTQFG